MASRIGSEEFATFHVYFAIFQKQCKVELYGRLIGSRRLLCDLTDGEVADDLK